MARYTQTHAEAAHLAKLADELPSFGILRLTLNNGRQVEGVVRGSSSGNNAGRDGPWAYYAETTLETIDGHTITVDWLDIRTWDDVWSLRSQDYEGRGLINIVGFPGEPPTGKPN